MTRVISIIGGKGGVGKTVLSSNLAYALTELGERVIAVDANLTTANLGMHFGMHLAPRTLHDVLRGKAKLKDAIYKHPYGFQVIPASLSVNDLRGVDAGKLSGIALSLLGKADYVIMDCAAGLGREAISAITAADEILLVTNPDMPSVTDALKTVNIAKRTGKSVLGVVVNRVKDKWHELTSREIEEMLDVPVIAEIPEDANVARAIALKTPVLSYDSDSPAAVEIKKLAHDLVGKPFKRKRQISLGILDRLVKWMVR